ncbi:MAG: hypothetical protein N2259_00790, partial [Patescibacteria group bacterium]|nr:hypothetical protein [Patescibacteria group bacterium]
RRRVSQIELAKKYNLKNYPAPAGGCLLCDREFAKRLKTMLENFGNLDENDTKLLRLGRHFWLDKTLIIVGRNHEENLKLKKIAKKGDILIELKDIPGPTTLVRGKMIVNKAIKAAELLTKKYSKKVKGRKRTFSVILVK